MFIRNKQRHNLSARLQEVAIKKSNELGFPKSYYPKLHVVVLIL